MMTTLEDLLNGHSIERAKGTPTLTPDSVAALLPLVPDWELGDDGKSIHRRLRTDGFSPAAALLVKIAALADAEDHHPDVTLSGYRWLDLSLSTHSIGGLSDNDFITAAKINRLLETET